MPTKDFSESRLPSATLRTGSECRPAGRRCLLAAITAAFVRPLQREQHSVCFSGITPSNEISWKALQTLHGKLQRAVSKMTLRPRVCLSLGGCHFVPGTERCLRDSHRLSSLATHKQCGFRCEYTVLNFLGRAASLGCLAVEHLGPDAHTQAFARSNSWGLTDFVGHKECKPRSKSGRLGGSQLICCDTQ